jgi:hypothetical protein
MTPSAHPSTPCPSSCSTRPPADPSTPLSLPLPAPPPIPPSIRSSATPAITSPEKQNATREQAFRRLPTTDPAPLCAQSSPGVADPLAAPVLTPFPCPCRTDSVGPSDGAPGPCSARVVASLRSGRYALGLMAGSRSSARPWPTLATRLPTIPTSGPGLPVVILPPALPSPRLRSARQARVWAPVELSGRKGYWESQAGGSRPSAFSTMPRPMVQEEACSRPSRRLPPGGLSRRGNRGEVRRAHLPKGGQGTQVHYRRDRWASATPSPACWSAACST